MQVPDGDILVHAGDLTNFFQPLTKSMEMLKDVNDWLGEMPHRHKIVIAGNHDMVFQEEPKKAKTLLTNAHYLENSGIELEGIRFWGSPVTPVQEMAFSLPKTISSREIWKHVPEDINVLVTHGPPYGIRDQNSVDGYHHGCSNLLQTLMRIQPQIHIFGHIHNGYGRESNRNGNWFLNCSAVNAKRELANPPVVIDLQRP